MFTGLIEAVGSVEAIDPGDGSTRIEVASSLDVGRIKDGESIAVDGVCLTVVSRRGNRFAADVVAETLSRTTLDRLEAGTRVNLERSVRLGDRLGGHLVQGHVDTAVPVIELQRRGDDCRLRLGLPPQIARYVALKGSVTVQGVSLTVCGLAEDHFEIALVPQTLERTTLGGLGPDDRVNVEVDLLARYLERLMVPIRGEG